VSSILNVARPTFFSSVDWFAFRRTSIMATLSPKMVTTLAGERNYSGIFMYLATIDGAVLCSAMPL
jgi:hypothetical protein